mgnify:CR=1 FL=1
MRWLLDPTRAITPEEVRRAFHGARTQAEAGRGGNRFRQARDGHLVLFLLATGARISEVLAVRRGDVVLRKDGAEVSMPRLKTKAPKNGVPPRTLVWLVPADADDLRSWVHWLEMRGAIDATPLFTGSPPDSAGRWTDPLTRQAARVAIKKLLASVGIERTGVAAHALRHGVAVTTLRTTGNTRAVQARLRHSDLKTTETYARMTMDDYRVAAQSARDFMEALE